MQAIATLIFAIVVATVICNNNAASVGDAEAVISPHIVGGTATNKTEYPFRPAVYDLKLHKDGKLIRTCKASEIERSWWLTAAECLDQDKYDTVEIEHRMNEKMHRHKILLKEIDFVVHPKYKKTSKEHNIALISPIFYPNKDGATHYIYLPKEGKNYEGKTVGIFFKWQQDTRARLDTKDSVDLLSIQTKVINPFWCTLWYPLSVIKSNKICISGWKGKALEQDDLGIPLLIPRQHNSFELIGIATVVRPWTRWFGLPIEFLNIDSHLDWIRRN